MGRQFLFEQEEEGSGREVFVGPGSPMSEYEDTRDTFSPVQGQGGTKSSRSKILMFTAINFTAF